MAICMPMRTRRESLLKLHQPDFGAAEEAAVLEVLRSGWLTKGPRTAQFERDFAARVSAPHALGLNSATAALHTALLAARIGPGDEVIVPAMTFAATANVVLHCGAEPVFCDVEPETHCIDALHAASLTTPRTRAIIPVHFAGIPCNMYALWQLAERQGIFILEDCAHAVEAEYRGIPVGTARRSDTCGGGSRFAAYSFYATKNLICGEGGMLACAQEDDLDRARVVSLHGMSSDAWRRYSGDGFRLYDIVEPGFKYNMFELQAALGLVQLAKLDSNWERRRRLVQQYDALIAAALPDGEVEFLHYPAYGKSAHHLYIVKVDASIRNRVIGMLLERNVQAYVHYICLTGTTLYRERCGTDPQSTPEAMDIGAKSITLPLFPDMTPGDVEYVVEALAECVKEALG